MYVLPLRLINLNLSCRALVNSTFLKVKPASLILFVERNLFNTAHCHVYSFFNCLLRYIAP